MLNIQAHSYELYYRLFYFGLSWLWTFFWSYSHIIQLTYLFTFPFLNKSKTVISLFEPDFIFINVFEGFSSCVFVSAVTATYSTLPIMMYLFFGFFKTGLFRYEKQEIRLISCLLLIFSLSTIFFLYTFFFPISLKFFLSFEHLITTELFSLKLESRISDYLHITLHLIMWAHLLFQIPFVLIYLSYQNVLGVSFLQDNRRVFIIVFIIMGGIFSPPDILSQLIIAVPLTIFFELTLFLCFVRAIYQAK